MSHHTLDVIFDSLSVRNNNMVDPQMQQSEQKHVEEFQTHYGDDKSKFEIGIVDTYCGMPLNGITVTDEICKVCLQETLFVVNSNSNYLFFDKLFCYSCETCQICKENESHHNRFCKECFCDECGELHEDCNCHGHYDHDDSVETKFDNDADQMNSSFDEVDREVDTSFGEHDLPEYCCVLTDEFCSICKNNTIYEINDRPAFCDKYFCYACETCQNCGEYESHYQRLCCVCFCGKCGEFPDFCICHAVVPKNITVFPTGTESGNLESGNLESGNLESENLESESPEKGTKVLNLDVNVSYKCYRETKVISIEENKTTNVPDERQQLLYVPQKMFTFSVTHISKYHPKDIAFGKKRRTRKKTRSSEIKPDKVIVTEFQSATRPAESNLSAFTIQTEELSIETILPQASNSCPQASAIFDMLMYFSKSSDHFDNITSKINDYAKCDLCDKYSCDVTCLRSIGRTEYGFLSEIPIVIETFA